MFEEVHTHVTNESLEGVKSLNDLTDKEIESYTRNFLGKTIIELSQEEIEDQLKPLLIELTKRNMSGFSLFSFVLPDNVTDEEIQSGDSSWAKVYKSLFSLSKTEEYKQSPELQMMVFELKDIINQNPQMMGPVAMWKTAKDIMWRRDIPSHAKGDLVEGMTFALAFSDTDKYEAELLKNLDFEKIENYAEVAHMLEALKQFWSSGHESYARDRVPDFYLQALRNINKTPEANYLLSIRVREILSILEHSEDFPNEARDLKPFELSKGTYASTQIDNGLVIIPEENNEDVKEAIANFDANEEKIRLPQWMLDEARARGERVITWQPPHELIATREQLFNQMHQYANVPIEERLGELGNVNDEKRQELLFDYEYLVSRPVREMVQREFNFELKDLSVREQFYFLNYLKQVNVADSELMKKFTSLYGVDGMRTFLSLERGNENLGDHIVAFGEHDEVAGTVFRYYSELLNSAERADTLVQEVSDCEGELCIELGNQVRENILNRAQKDLEDAVRSHNPSEVATQIENYVVAAKEYVALLQEVGAGKIESVSPEALTTEERVRMQDLLRKNYDKAYPEPENNDFKETVASSLTKSFGNPNTTFRVLRDNDKIVSFNRFDTLRDYTGKEVLYLGSFNADPAYSGVGRIMLEETVKEQLENGHPMMAHCDPTQAITKKYIEDGFVATGLYSLAGKPSFEIWRSKDSIAQLESKERTIQELLSSDEGSESIVVREQSESETYPELQSGMGLTRYFTHQKKTYLVFEKLIDSLKSEFTSPQEELKEAS